jgi:signal transduction histidine kinase
MRRSTAASLRLEFALLTGFLLLVGVLRFTASAVMATQVETVTGALDEARRNNAAVLQSLTDAETGVRGFQLTGDARFLEPYAQGVRDYPAAMQRSLAAAPTQEIRRLLLAEREAAQAWLTGFAAPLAAAPAGHPDRPAERNAEGRNAEGKVLFDRLRAANGAVVAALEAQQRRVISRLRTTGLVSEAVLAALSVLSALLAMLIGRRIGRRLLRPMDRMRAALVRIGAGDRSARAPEDDPPEIRAVIRTLDELLDAERRRQVEDAGRVRLRLAALELRSRLSQRLSWASVLEAAAAAVGQALRTQRVYLYATGDDDTLPAATEWHAPELTAVPLPSLPPETGTGPVLSPDGAPDPALPDGVAGYLRQAAATAYAFVPFGAGTPAAGGLVVAECAAPRGWDPEELAFLEAGAADLTRALDQVRLDEQQEELVNRLRELNRRRTEFVNMVSHDLRGPLTSILSYVDDITQDEGLTDQQRAGLAVITRNTRRLTGMTDELLALARAESPSRSLEARPVRLATLVADVVASMEPIAQAGGLTLHRGVPDDLWIEGDAGQLERALLNLVGNAVKFTPPGGRVEVTATERQTGGVQLSVRDTGIGVPERERATLFEPFRRARNATAAAIPGTGLGLAIVRAVVQQHHGTVGLESTEGAGTVITVTLPSCPADRRGEPAART